MSITPRRPLGVAATGALVAAVACLPARPAAVPAQADGGTRGSAVVWPDEGPARWAPRPTAAAITANDLRTRLYQIADDSMRGRRIGEPGNAMVTDYVAAEFRRLGLRPAGEGGSYFQLLPFGAVGFDTTAQLAVNGVGLALRTDWIPAAPATMPGVTGSADVAAAPTVFAGTWGDTSVALDPALLRGRIAVFVAPPSVASGATASLMPVLPRCDSVPDRFGADAAIALEAAQRAQREAAARAPAAPASAATATQTVIARSAGPVRDARAANAGAAGVLVVGLDAMSAAAITTTLAARRTLQPENSAGATVGIAGATISRAAAMRLFGRPLDQLAVGATGQPVTARWSYAWRPSVAPARNVIAMLPGSDPARANEFVLVGAHNDHVGIATAAVDHDSLRAVNTVTRRQGANDTACRPTADQQRRIDSLIAHARRIRAPRRDSIMNGADDDGSGTAVLLELAERFAAERPARSVLFVSHTGEEGGLLGSRWFTEHPTVPLANVVAAINMDMVGKGRVEQVRFGGPNSVQMLGARRLSREFGDVIDSVNANSPEPMAIDRSWDVPANPLNRFCRSDQVYYVLANIPTVYLSLGYAQDYHQPTDEPQYIDYDHSARLGRFVHDVMLALADRPERPAISGADPSFPRCR